MALGVLSILRLTFFLKWMLEIKMKKYIFLRVIFCILSMNSNIISASIVTEYLTINTDTFIRISTIGSPGVENINYGHSERIYVAGEQWTAWGAGRTLISFDASLIPSTAQNIRLNLYAYSGDTRSSYDSRIELYRTTDIWNEMTATWNNKPSFDSGQIYDQVIINHNTIVGWYEWDITSLVQEWQAGTYSNNGLMLYDSPSYSGGGNRNFYSSENVAHADLVPTIAYDIDSAQTVPAPAAAILFFIGLVGLVKQKNT
jgi:hypothetical protein